jgi:FHS family L-fucose permease-like MFS transporter
MKQTSNKYNTPFIVVTSLFFLWALAHNLNPILIPHLKKACALTDFQSALIDSSFFIAYFVMAIPAGVFMQRYGYKKGVITGLLLFSAGAFLFYPAASVVSYSFFLSALFVIACGLTFLETAANPYVTALGKPETATERLNFAQSFNGLGATLAPLIGGKFILSGKHLNADDITMMTPEQLRNYYVSEAASVQIPYLIIGLLVLSVAFIFYKIHLPEIKEEEIKNVSDTENKNIFQFSNLRAGIVAQFFYVGAQVGVGSFFIRFLSKAANLDEKTAAYYLSVALLLFMLGRFIGTALMKFITPHKLLASYSIINIVLLLIAINFTGTISVYTLMLVEFFMSIMFPTIFSLSIKGLGSKTKLGSSLIIMSIVGGAIIPLLMGKISDATSIRWAYYVPMICFLPVAYFGTKGYKTKNT